MSEETALSELVGFLTPTTRLDVRRAALEYIVGISGSLDGSAGRIFSADNFAVGKSLCHLCEVTVADRSPTLAALTNFTSGSAEAASYIMANSGVPAIAYSSCILGAPFAGYAARLLANLSRHLPDRVFEQLDKQDQQHLSNIIDIVIAGSEESDVVLLGYVIVNTTTLSKVRHVFVEQGLLPKIYTLLTDGYERKREIAADILRNLSFEEGLHERLLPDTADDFLVALLQPLADGADDLDEDETQKLPLRLQYYEGTREPAVHVRQKLIEALYQLCATKHGRETLRRKGAYVLLRELDRATGDNATADAPPPKMRPPHLIAQEEHTLHALIGILIRYEDEMCVSEGVSSLKDLQ